VALAKEETEHQRVQYQHELTAKNMEAATLPKEETERQRMQM
jgi:hypothetical protein